MVPETATKEPKTEKPAIDPQKVVNAIKAIYKGPKVMKLILSYS